MAGGSGVYPYLTSLICTTFYLFSASVSSYFRCIDNRWSFSRPFCYNYPSSLIPSGQLAKASGVTVAIQTKVKATTTKWSASSLRVTEYPFAVIDYLEINYLIRRQYMPPILLSNVCKLISTACVSLPTYLFTCEL